MLNKHNKNVEIQVAPSPILSSQKLILHSLQNLFSEIIPLKICPLKQLGHLFNGI